MALQTKVEESFLEKNVSFLSQLKKEHLVAGVAGGAFSAFALHPLDLLKIRFAVHEGATLAKHRPQYSGFLHAIKTVYLDEGIRGLYRGVTTNVVGSSAAWGLYFFFYNAGKTWCQNGDLRRDLGPAMHMTIASFSGACTLVVTNPIWVAKTRLCLQYGGPSQKPYASGLFTALTRIHGESGVRGLYKGFVPGLFGVSHGALQFMIYEEMKSTFNQRLNRPVNHKLATWEYLTFAACSKVVASASTYPYQVIRSRLQDQHREYKGTIDVIGQTWRNEGMRGFYKGLFPNLLRVAPATGITFVVYESVISFFGAR